MITSCRKNPKNDESSLDMQIGVIKTCLQSIERSKKRSLETKREEFNSAVEAGKALVFCKDKLKHSNWLPWLKMHFELSDKTASNYMNLYRNAELVSDLVSDERITNSMLYILCTLKKEELNKALEKIAEKNGDSISVTYVSHVKRTVQNKPKKEPTIPHRITHRDGQTGSVTDHEKAPLLIADSKIDTTPEIETITVSISPAMNKMITDFRIGKDETIEQIFERALTIALEHHRKTSAQAVIQNIASTKPAPSLKTDPRLEPEQPKEIPANPMVKPAYVRTPRKPRVGSSPAVIK